MTPAQNTSSASSSGPGGDLFADVDGSPAAHFRLCLYGSMLGVLDYAARAHGSFEEAMRHFPFLAGYYDELALRLNGLSSQSALDRWCESMAAWESRVPGHLPLLALRRHLGFNHHELCLLLTVGLVEEDGRFGALIEALQGLPGVRRPTLGFLARLWAQSIDAEALAERAAGWRERGLLVLSNPGAPRGEQTWEVPALVWSLLRGGTIARREGGCRFTPVGELPRLGDLVLPDAVRAAFEAAPRVLARGHARAVVVRGPGRNGRRTALGALARELGRGLYEFSAPDRPDDPRWKEAALAGLLGQALPAAVFGPGLREDGRLPDDWPNEVPLGVVLGGSAGLSGGLAADAIVISVGIPDLAARQTLWERQLGDKQSALAAAAAERFRLPSGMIRRVARGARAHAALADRDHLEIRDIRAASRATNRRELENLARFIAPGGDLARLCAGDFTHQQLRLLEQRCRHRERLAVALRDTPGSIANCGVRALFTGPSGTGKTLAARLLAGNLDKDLYQLDLAAVVNKYIGETEKNLNRVFEMAEELDVLLLLDEGDALLTRRTDVFSSNDRYANLETNFLLQRLESFDGIVIITTNSRARIDPAFERRMDVLVEFHAPDAAERWRLWTAHLPRASVVDDECLSEISTRCELTGGQIRNAALHATLLALDGGGALTPAQLEEAVRREYMNRGGVCPLV